MRAFTSLGLAVVALAACAAFADVVRPGYVEQCTLEKHSTAGLLCKACRAFYGARDRCPKTLGAEGYTQKCRTGGASVWMEVWCKAEAAEVAPAPAAKAEADGGSSVAPTTAPGDAPLAAPPTPASNDTPVPAPPADGGAPAPAADGGAAPADKSASR